MDPPRGAEAGAFITALVWHPRYPRNPR